MNQDVINQYIEKCHSASRNAGWFTDITKPIEYDSDGVPVANLKRNVGEMMVLIHSEISEAYEGGSSPDDKLPHRCAIEVELADTLIRIFDLAGYKDLNLNIDSDLNLTSVEHFPFDFVFSKLHSMISNSYEGYRKSDIKKFEKHLSDVVAMIIEYGSETDLDLIGAIDEKLEFNARRSDHKIENRLKSDGKKT